MRKIKVLGLMTTFLFAACDPSGPPPMQSPLLPQTTPATEAEITATPAVCEVPGSSEFLAVAAYRDGVVFARMEAGMGFLDLELQRFDGIGCALHSDGTALAAAEELLDADDQGNLYVFPRETAAPGVVSTLSPDDLPGHHAIVAKVDRGGEVTKVVEAGRGVWSFGISPDGGSMWVTACGPTGIFSTEHSPLQAAMTQPQTLWAHRPSVLTSDTTFWSVGHRTCAPGEPLTPECGLALVRTTPAGSAEVGTTIVDVGSGYEEATLVRCGAGVCGVLPRAVTVWSEAGALTQTLTAADAALDDSEQILQASGNQHGVYLLVEGLDGRRVMFVRYGHPSR